MEFDVAKGDRAESIAADSQVDAALLKVVAVTAEDPFYTYRFFAEFLRLLPQDTVRVLAIVNLKPFNSPSYWNLTKKMMDFYGWRDFIRMGLRYTWKRARRRTLKSLARRNGIKILTPHDMNSHQVLSRLAGMTPDVIVSVAAPQIFSKQLLDLPPLGCWNIHGGRLPRYRGMMPCFWTLLHGEKTGAITVHKMNARLDDGEILLQRTYAIEPAESLDHLIRRSKVLGARVLLDALQTIRSGNYELLPNNRAQATYFSFPTRKDVRQFREKGLRLL